PPGRCSRASSIRSSSWTSCSPSAPTSCWRWRSGRSASSSTTTCDNELLICGDRCYRYLSASLEEPMPHFTKPPEGSWTEHYGLGTGPISYEDSISPEHYEL